MSGRFEYWVLERTMRVHYQKDGPHPQTAVLPRGWRVKNVSELCREKGLEL